MFEFTRKLPIVMFVVFALLTSTFAQGTNQSQPATTAAAARVSQGPVIQYADEQLAVITWTTDTATEGRVYYGTDAGNLGNVAEDKSVGTRHRVHLSNLQPGTTYYFQVDTGAQRLETMQFNTPDTGAPPLRDVAATRVATTPSSSGVQVTKGPTIQYADDRSAVITWNTNLPVDSAIYYGPNQASLNQSAFGDKNTTNHRVYVSDLSPDTTYYLQVDTGSPESRIYTLRTIAAGAPPVYDRAAIAAGAPQGGSTPQLGRRPDNTIQPGSLIVPAGTEVQARLENDLSTERSRAGDQFTATITTPVNAGNGRVAIPAGARIRGEVSSVEAGKTLPSIRGKARLNLKFNEILLPNGTAVPMTATLVSVTQGRQASAGEEGEVRDRTTGGEVAKTVGIGAGLGTIAGLIFGSTLKGLAIGAIAGGGYVLATQGGKVSVPAESGLVVRLDRALSVPPQAVQNTQQQQPQQ